MKEEVRYHRYLDNHASYRTVAFHIAVSQFSEGVLIIVWDLSCDTDSGIAYPTVCQSLDPPVLCSQLCKDNK